MMSTRSIDPRPLAVALLLSLVGGCDESTGPDEPINPDGPTTGAVHVAVSTTGSPFDPDGYRVILGAEAPRPLGANGTLEYAELEADDYEVELKGVASNCTVSGANPRTVTVVAGATVSTTFAVSCVPTGDPTGSIRVLATTTGASLDADGYTVTLDGGTPRSKGIGINGTVTFSKLEAGEHAVALTGMSSNCTVTGPNPRTVPTVARQDVLVDFEVECTFVRRDLAFETDRDGDRDGNVEIYGINGDGSGLVRLTDYWARDTDPAGSPDGSRIAFARNDAVHVMGAGGSDPLELIEDGAGPAWSPNGTKIAFTRVIGADLEDWGDLHIFVMNADGSASVRITHDSLTGSQPTWSPDGSRIAFAGNQDTDIYVDIYVMAADGSNPINLTNHPGYDGDPAWSPDGTRIAFTGPGDVSRDIYVMDADGSNPINLTNHPGYDGDPAWSPDGTRIAFATDRDGNREVYVMDADGSNPVNLTRHPARDLRPTWIP